LICITGGNKIADVIEELVGFYRILYEVKNFCVVCCFGLPVIDGIGNPFRRG
jgi:hypothetical protein